MRSIFRCSPKRFVKFTIVCASLIGLIIYFPRDHKPIPNVYKARPLDYVDPDVQLRRDPGLAKFTAKPKRSSKPTIYTKLDVIPFSHSCKPRLKVGGSDVAICVYGKKLDSMVSSYVTDHGTWEKEQLDIMELILKQNKNMQVVDIGCNIGIYTLFATKMGRKVIAVDPLESNLQLLQKSLMLGKYSEKVTLVHNAISDHPEKVKIDLRLGNIGGTHVNRQPDPFKPHKRVKRYKRLVNKSRNKKSVAQQSKLKSKNSPQKQKRSTKSTDPRKNFQFKIPNVQNGSQNQRGKPQNRQVKPQNQQVKPQIQRGKPQNQRGKPQNQRGKPMVQQIHQGNRVANLPKNLKSVNSNDYDINKLLPGRRIGPNLSVDAKPKVKNLRNVPAIKPKNNPKVKKPVVNLKTGKDNSQYIKPKLEKTKGKKSAYDNSGVLRQDRSLVQAVTMDDLVQLGSFRPTFLKIDIEGWEYLALREASIFLREFDVRYIMMEWTNLRRSSNGSKVVTYLIKNGFLPYKNDKKDEFLDVQKSGAWPDNVLWKKR